MNLHKLIRPHPIGVAEYKEKTMAQTKPKTQKPKKTFIPMTKAQKIEYAKQFKPETVQAYRKGKRNGFLDGVHAPKRTKVAK